MSLRGQAGSILRETPGPGKEQGREGRCQPGTLGNQAPQGPELCGQGPAALPGRRLLSRSSVTWTALGADGRWQELGLSLLDREFIDKQEEAGDTHVEMA